MHTFDFSTLRFGDSLVLYREGHRVFDYTGYVINIGVAGFVLQVDNHAFLVELRPEGWLVTVPCEPNPAFFKVLQKWQWNEIDHDGPRYETYAQAVYQQLDGADFLGRWFITHEPDFLEVLPRVRCAKNFGYAWAVQWETVWNANTCEFDHNNVRFVRYLGKLGIDGDDKKYTVNVNSALTASTDSSTATLLLTLTKVMFEAGDVYNDDVMGALGR